MSLVAADKQPTYAYQMVRTDAREQTLDAFMVPKSVELETEEEGAMATKGGVSGSGSGTGGNTEVMEVEGADGQCEGQLQHGASSAKERYCRASNIV